MLYYKNMLKIYILLNQMMRKIKTCKNVNKLLKASVVNFSLLLINEPLRFRSLINRVFKIPYINFQAHRISNNY